MTGGDVFRRKIAASVQRVMTEAPQTFQRVGEEWAERDYLPYVRAISAVDTGEYQSKHEVEVTETQVTVKNTAPHAFDVEYGNSTHTPQMTITTAVEATATKLTRRCRDAIKKELT